MKTKNIIISTLTASLLATSIPTQAFASETQEVQNNNEVIGMSVPSQITLEPTDLLINENEILSFDTVQDKNNYIKEYGIRDVENIPNTNNTAETNNSTANYSLTYINGNPAKKYSDKKHYKVFAGWMTPGWAKHSSFKYEGGIEYGFSASVDGVEIKTTKKFAAGGSIPVPKANRSKYSRLAKRVDVQIKKYYVYATVGGTYKVNKKKILDRYFTISYK